MPIRVFVVDDEPRVRSATIDYLQAFEDLHVVGEASGGLEAVNTFQESRPDVILLDISMPNMNGFEAARRMLAIKPDAKIIMLSAMSRRVYLKIAHEAGAMDFVEKSSPDERLVRSIREVALPNRPTLTHPCT